jgi:deoxyribodipyrimidine photo-lyase
VKRQKTSPADFCFGKVKNAVVYWFRKDLRLHDQVVLNDLFASNTPFVALYCLDETLFQHNQWGFQNSSAIPIQFLLDTLKALEKQLAALGVPLVFKVGKPAHKILAYVSQNQVREVYTEILPGTNEEAQLAHLQTAAARGGFLLHTHQKNTLLAIKDLPFDLSALPAVFTVFRKKVELHAMPSSVVQMTFPQWPALSRTSTIPNLTELGYPIPAAEKRQPYVFEAGEKGGLARLNKYFWQNHHIKTYKETRNGLVGDTYSSRLSPWLALGAVSPRLIYAELKRYETENGANESTYWLYFELLWRDYFQFVALQAGAQLFQPGGIREQTAHSSFKPAVFDRWRFGKTGQPFVDANMRELLQTGWMSNRGRQNVASYLIHDLKQDWRAGAAWFEAQLIDYDVASNYGNWNYLAGVGNDPHENRRFNLEKQAAQYDADGAYRRLWLS